MPLRFALLALALIAAAAFAIANWGAIVQPVPVSLIVTQVQAPLGLILLGFAVVLVTIFAGVLLVQQARVIAEARRWHKEVETQRSLADQAEASRFTELRDFLAAELAKIDRRDSDQQLALLARVTALEEALRQGREESTNSLAAYVGEVDEKLDRLLAR